MKQFLYQASLRLSRVLTILSDLEPALVAQFKWPYGFYSYS